MSSYPQLEELERFEALILAYYVDLYYECFYTDEKWANLISDAETADTDDDLDAQLQENERFKPVFDHFYHDQWISFCAQHRPQ
ncbi:unnamed protein product [Pylaiella littoralis]